MVRKVNETDDLNKISHIYEESWKPAAKERHSLVMIEDDRMIGTSSYASSRLSKLEIWWNDIYLYVARLHWRSLWQKLHPETIKCLKEKEYRDLYLWVLEENIHAKKVYEDAGFLQNNVIIEDVISGKVVHEVRYQYHIDGGNDVRL